MIKEISIIELNWDLIEKKRNKKGCVDSRRHQITTLTQKIWIFFISLHKQSTYYNNVAFIEVQMMSQMLDKLKSLLLTLLNILQ